MKLYYIKNIKYYIYFLNAFICNSNLLELTATLSAILTLSHVLVDVFRPSKLHSCETRKSPHIFPTQYRSTIFSNLPWESSGGRWKSAKNRQMQSLACDETWWEEDGGESQSEIEWWRKWAGKTSHLMERYWAQGAF